MSAIDSIPLWGGSNGPLNGSCSSGLIWWAATFSMYTLSMANKLTYLWVLELFSFTTSISHQNCPLWHILESPFRPFRPNNFLPLVIYYKSMLYHHTDLCLIFSATKDACNGTCFDRKGKMIAFTFGNFQLVVVGCYLMRQTVPAGFDVSYREKEVCSPMWRHLPWDSSMIHCMEMNMWPSHPPQPP